MDRIGWERFESFCEDLLAELPGFSNVHRHGNPGDKQDGIDISAIGPKKKKWTFQSKRRKGRLTPGEIRAAVKSHTYGGSRHILLYNLTASAPSRKEMRSHKAWELWDCRDLSRKVRRLPSPASRRLVETHFGPAYVKSFLGLHGPPTFETRRQRFQLQASPEAAFHHNWELVGREGVVSRLESFASSDKRRVALLPGRGGIGKSKLLFELSRRVELKEGAPQILFLAEQTPAGLHLGELPSSPCLIIVDDAHRRNDLAPLYGAVRSRPFPTWLLLASRPQGIDPIIAELTRSQIDYSQVERFEELGDLSLGEVEQLAEEVLGEKSTNSHRLALLTRDCPLVTVTGGRLLRKKLIPPSLLERDTEFRTIVLAHFSDECTGAVSGDLEPKTVRAVLELVAAIQPVELSNSGFLNEAAQFLGLPVHQFVQTLGALQRVGVLIKQGDRARLVPDVLADFLLDRACFGCGQPTNFAESVLRSIPLAYDHVLVNLAELDWRTRITNNQETALLNGVWADIVDQVRKATPAERRMRLEQLRPMAYYQPGRIVPLVAEIVEASLTGKTGEEERERTLDSLSRLLERASYSVDHLGACCDLLWRLGRNDKRETNPNPAHPIRILSDMARYGSNKPLSYFEVLADRALGWLSEKAPAVHSPFEILDQLLEKTSHDETSTEEAITFHPFLIDYERTKKLRRKVLDAALHEARSSNLWVAVRAVEALGLALKDPSPMFGMASIPAKQTNSWRPEQRWILTELGRLIREDLDPIVLLEISDAAWPMAAHARPGFLKIGALQIRNWLPRTIAVRLTANLTTHAMQDHIRASDRDDSHKFDSASRQWEVDSESLAREIVAAYPMPLEALRYLDARFQSITRAARDLRPHVFLQALGTIAPKFSLEVCRHLLGGEGKCVAPYLHELLNVLRRSHPRETIQYLVQAVHDGRPAIVSSLGRGYSWGLGSNRPFEPTELRLMRALLRQEDEKARLGIISRVRELYRFRPGEALRVVMELRPTESERFAETLAHVFGGDWGIPLDSLCPEQLLGLLGKLLPARSLHDYGVQKLIKAIGEIDFAALLAFLMKRIELDEGIDRLTHLGGFQPIPYSWDVGVLSPLNAPQNGALRTGFEAWAQAGNAVRRMWARRLLRSDAIDECTWED